MKTPQDCLKDYESKLSLQSWSEVEPFIHGNAVFIFTEGTFRGKEQISQALMRTFSMIKEEKYWLSDLNWIVETSTTASCEYSFNWEGLIDNKKASGSGRGSSVLVKTENEWQIILEHLSPPAKS